jgi:hypothetical protein
MPLKDPEARKAYMKQYNKQYRAKNKEHISEQKREYMKQYCENNKDKIKEYRETPEGKKSKTISRWKARGLICPDYDSLYCHYLNATECENCDVTFGEFGDGTQTHKCMDHSHKTGLFRNFLCCKCNVKRG